MEKGRRNLITEVPGVKVGHFTIHEGEVHTGVTVLIPHGGDLFHDKCPAAVHVINGFGKSAGLVQVAELGSIETPLVFTNTLSTGAAWDALARYMVETNGDIALKTGSVNPVVFECNDAYLNDMRGFHIIKEHVREALDRAAEDFEEGAVGAGAGMCCYSLKGGIGSASRVFSLYGNEYVLGTLLLTNFGSLQDLIVAGEPGGKGCMPNCTRMQSRTRAASSSSSPRTRRFPTGSFFARRGAHKAGLRVPAASQVRAAERSRWRFPPKTACPIIRRANPSGYRRCSRMIWMSFSAP